MISKVDETEADVMTIENIGAIDHLEAPAKAGTIVVLRGRNGSGKSTALKAANAVINKRSAALTSRDGTVGGFASLFGVTIKVARNGANRRLNDTEVVGLEDAFDIATFVDPGIQDKGKADNHRIKAMASLVGAKVALDNLYGLVKSREEFESIVSEKSLKISDPIDLCEAVKRDLEAASRAQTAAATNAHSAALAKLGENDGLDLSAPCGEQALRNALTDAINARSKLLADKAAWNDRIEDAKKAQDAIAKAEAAYTGLSVDEAHAATESAKATEAEHVQRVGDLERQLAEIERQLSIARPQLESARNATLQAIRIENSAAAHRDAIAGWQKTITASTERGCPCSDEDLATAESRVKAAQAAMEYGSRVREGLQRKADAEQREKDAEEFRNNAERYREAAQGTLDVLAQAVKGASQRITFSSDFRLLINHPIRQQCYVADLSHGELWSLAIDMVIEAALRVGVRAAMVIPQEAWEGLDDLNKSLVIDKVVNTDITVFTAENYVPSADERDMSIVAYVIDSDRREPASVVAAAV